MTKGETEILITPKLEQVDRSVCSLPGITILHPGSTLLLIQLWEGLESRPLVTKTIPPLNIIVKQIQS